MKKFNRNEWFPGAENCALHANSTGQKAISAAALALLFSAILTISGCIGLTSAPKPASSQQTAPGAATISVAPASVSFGSVPLGDMASQSVTISNNGGSNLTVTQASTAASGITITGISLPLTIAAGKQATFNVIFSPKAAGAISGKVSVMTDVSSSPNTVTLSGTGMAATALLTTSASSLSFGNVAMGRSSALSVTVTNAGNSNVTLSNVSVSGAHFAESGVSSGLILTPGQSATLDATFSPVAVGNLSGSLTVDSNAANSPMTISLSGSGTQTNSHFVSLSWISSTSAVAGYNVYRSEVSGGPYSRLDSSPVAADSYTDSSVQPGLTYYYVVTSITSSGSESADSTQASATVPTP
ncbi:MAG TPA: choice-of-anchor D domain-containing protein [Candidatus Acidoferrum sp.]|nr:choice-of-anchor D domain-containing protein [Candidatus Acidoferrum sp.]